MPDFQVSAMPPSFEGQAPGCVCCGTSNNDYGFIILTGDTIVKSYSPVYGREALGQVQIVLCGTCIHQIGRMVGMATPQDQDEFSYKERNYLEKIEKLEGEVAARDQRFLNLVRLTPEDVGLVTSDSGSSGNLPADG